MIKKLSFVCFSQNTWEKRRARKQQFMLHLSFREDVAKILYIKPPLNLPCVPCSFVVPPARSCKYGHRGCVEGIRAIDVLIKAEEILKPKDL